MVLARRESGDVKCGRTGQHDRDSSRDRAGGGSRAALLRMHSETFRWGNHPSRHRKERDDAALLTQEGTIRGTNI